MTRLFSVQSLLYLALVLALAASLKHVAFAFATTNGGDQVEAYISAVAIDLGLLALAAGISKRSRTKRSTWPLWVGVVLFSVISVYANWLAGIAHVSQISASVGRLGQWLVNLRPVLLSSVLPILVIYLSEIVSSDHQNDLAMAEREAKREAKRHVVPADLDRLAQARDKKQADIAQRRRNVAKLHRQGDRPEDIAEALGVSVRTIRRDIHAVNGRG